MGAGLLEQGHSVAYVVRALNDTEQRYAKIEKDLLAVVFALEEFETSASGRRVVVESDHKEIVPIRKRALISAPKRLEHILLRSQDYDNEKIYKPGMDMYVADTLNQGVNRERSRANKHDRNNSF